MLQFDNLNTGDRFADASGMSAPRVQLGLPGEQNAITKPVLQGFKFGGQLRMQQCRDAVRLGVIDRPVEHEVRVWAQPLPPALLPRDRVMACEPYPQTAGVEVVGVDGSVADNKSRDGRSGCCAVCLKRFRAGRMLQVSVACSLERVGDRVSSPA